MDLYIYCVRMLYFGHNQCSKRIQVDNLGRDCLDIQARKNKIHYCKLHSVRMAMDYKDPHGRASVLFEELDCKRRKDHLNILQNIYRLEYD
jgi:hypothetical protein